NAPAGGVGHRTSLRGGGPLTTLLVPKAEEATLWRTVWLNVLTSQQFEPGRVYEGSAQGDTAIFPWLTPTRTSEGDRKALPIDTHPLQMYWAMPRRIRLNLDAVEAGACDLCGETSAALVTSFTTKNYGTSYAQFVHPLSPHSIDEKRNLKLPRHGQPGGVGYRDWLGLVFLRGAEGREPAKVVLAAAGGMDTRRRVSGLGIWAFGYDMDNMKARAWCDARLPWFDVPESQRSECVRVAGRAIEAAEKVEYLLRDALRRVWFGKLKQFDREKRRANWDMPKSAKLDSDAMLALQATFWRETTEDFFVLVKAILNEEDEQAYLQVWHAALWKKVQSLFEQATRDAACDVEQLKRQVVVAEELRGYCHGRALREALGLIVEEGTSGRKRA
ncbi:MAG: type I-E CRISPR-associated protein Cse1/CasA, partial [Chitinimonas sp.]|nr:type I-E CRISPR-associated protein Cse1/CasA [Chitinimonas sp.]